MVPDPVESDRSPVTTTVIESLIHAIGPLDRQYLARAVVVMLESVLVAYGLREFLRAFAGVGWLGLLGALHLEAGN